MNEVPIHTCKIWEMGSKYDFCKQCCRTVYQGQTARALHNDGSFRFSGRSPKTVFSLMLKRQKTNRIFNPFASHLSYRDRVVDWLKRLVEKMECKQLTLHLSIAYLDVVLSMCKPETDQIQVIAFCCLYLAAKLEEKDKNLPALEEAVILFQNKFSISEIEEFEAKILKLMDFRMNLITPFHLVKFFLSIGIIFDEDLNHLPTTLAKDFLSKFELMCDKLLSFTLEKYEFYKFTSAVVAASVMNVAFNQFALPKSWRRVVQPLVNLTQDQIQECTALIEDNFTSSEQLLPSKEIYKSSCGQSSVETTHLSEQQSQSTISEFKLSN